jgi:hypothetical protein
MVCTAVDGDGVSDYIRFQISHYLIVINLADILIVAGLALVLLATLAAYGGRARRAAAPAVPSGPGTSGTVPEVPDPSGTPTTRSA